jgi:tetratricopeptide (TPR) repeat protein
MALSNLAACYTNLGKPEEALEMYRKARSMYGSTVCSNNANEVITISKIAGLYIRMYIDHGKLDKLDDALDLLHEALAIFRRILGEKHPTTAWNLAKIGSVYRMQGKFELALKVLKKALKYRRRFLDDGHRSVAQSISEIALVHMERNNFADALVMLEEAGKIFSDALGNQSECFGNHCIIVARCKERMGDLEGALASAREAHRIYSKLGVAGQVQAAAAMVQRLQRHARHIAC